jgi:hypothetical protein
MLPAKRISNIRGEIFQLTCHAGGIFSRTSTVLDIKKDSSGMTPLQRGCLPNGTLKRESALNRRQRFSPIISNQQQATSQLYKIFGKVANASRAKFAWTHELLFLYLMWLKIATPDLVSIFGAIDNFKLKILN